MHLGRIVERTHKRLRAAGRFVNRFGARRGLRAYAQIAAAKRTKGAGAFVELDVPHSPASVRLRAGGADAHAFWQVFVEGDYDVDIPFEPAVIVDAGAHIGLASLYFAHRFPGAHIVAIEPEPANARLLQHNLRSFDRVQVLEAALWSTPSPVRIANPQADSWSFRVSGQGSGKSVAAVTLPEIVRTVGCIDILKLDVEGTELDLFSADVSWLRQVRMLIVEFHERYAPGCTTLVHSVLRQHGFEHVLDRGENAVYLRAGASADAA